MLVMPTFPPGWGKPTPAIVETVEQASEQFGVPKDLIYSVIRKESNFNPRLRGYKHAGNSETYRKSYEKYKDKVIPGSSMTWGQMFKPEDWRPYGLMQLNPYHLVGKAGGVKAGVPLSKLFDPVPNIRIACAYLAALYTKHNNWETALKVYNGSTTYVKLVVAYIDELKAHEAAA